MKFFMAVMLLGFLTGYAIAQPNEDEQQGLPREQMQKCLAEADAAVANYKTSESLSQVAQHVLDRLDTYESMEDIGTAVVHLIGSLQGQKGQQLMRECAELDAFVRPALYRGSCGPDFGWEIDIHGEERADHLEGHDHLAQLIAYRGVCESLMYRDDAQPPAQ